MWGDMKPMLNSQVEIPDYFSHAPRKDWSIGLVKLITISVIFMAGLVIGLSISAHFGRYYNSQTDLFFPSTMYTSSCGEKDCMDFRSFVKPSHLMHTMTDQQLHWRATLVPKMEEFPFNRVPKVAFLFMTRGPLPFAPLWDLFFKGHSGLYSVYVHTLPDYKLNVMEDSAFYGRQIPSEVRFVYF
jgi:Core-2/I-Branching enzyme